jgi:hypothetical protein
LFTNDHGLQPWLHSFAAPRLESPIQGHGRPDIVLQPIAPDVFQGGLVELAKFSRDGQGRVSGLTIPDTGVRNLQFERINPAGAVYDRPGRS